MRGHANNRRFLFWLALGTAAMALAMAVLLVFALAQRRAVQLAVGLRNDSITSPAFECEREFLRFRQALDSAVNSRNPPDHDELTLRYDLFLSRLTLLRDSPSISLLVQRPEYQLVMPQLEQWARRADRVLARPQPDARQMADLLEEVNTMAIDVHALSLAANSVVSRLLEKQENTLLGQTEQIVGLTLAQLVLLLIAATALVVRNKRQEQERRALEVLTDKLHRSQEALARSETKAALSTVIASVSHELSTPLGNSLMTASTLVDQSRDFRRAFDSDQLKRSELSAFVENVCEGNDLMLRNLQRAVALLKNFRQVANDQASEQRRRFDLAQVVQEVVDTLAPSLKRQPHTLVIDIPAGITMDSLPGPLGQVIINVVNNAYLHAFEGRSDGVLTIRATQGGGRAHLVFTDNGVGMSPQTQSRLFQPFFSTKTGEGGTGLGMTIVADLIRKALGGTLEVYSTVGGGTTLRVDLPLVAPPNEEWVAPDARAHRQDLAP